MKVTLTVATTVDVDPERLREKLHTEGLTATEATKVFKDKVWRILDDEYSEHGRFGDYTREIRDDIKEVAADLGVLTDSEQAAQLKVSRPQDEEG